jgi:DNA-directed RNA polymerase subunit K/omega
MNAELVNKALQKVLNANVLVILVSRRVRQLNAGGGGLSRPLIANVGNLGAADVALSEIVEDKMGFEMPDIEVLARPNGKSRKKPQHSARNKTAPAGEENVANGFPARKQTETFS